MSELHRPTERRFRPMPKAGSQYERDVKRIHKLTDALQKIYWLGGHREVEEIIIEVLTPQERTEWKRARRLRRGLPLFALVCALAAGTYAAPHPLRWACLAGLGIVWLVTPVGSR